jgi:pimeloyl-ACP methyl ester carboxylesterase
MADIRIMQLPDGRELAWLEVGKLKGPVVFAFHGTPGSHRQVAGLADAITAAGVRLIAPDRPGYGHSTFHKGRTLVEWTTDVTALADHIGVSTFSVVGVSGGGPHASVCARFLPDRVTAAGIVSGVGPLDDPRASEGMMGMNKALSALSRRSMYLVYPMFGAQTAITRRWPEALLQRADKMLPAADVAVMQRPDVMEMFVEDSRRASATSAMAAAQDFTLFARDWGFRLEDIAVPVHVWHGDADRNVPYAHGQQQAERIPNAVFHACPGEGHLLVVDHLSEILHTVSTS